MVGSELNRTLGKRGEKSRRVYPSFFPVKFSTEHYSLNAWGTGSMGIKLREHPLSCPHVTRAHQTARIEIHCYPPSTHSHRYPLRKNWTVAGEVIIKATAERNYIVILGFTFYGVVSQPS